MKAGLITIMAFLSINVLKLVQNQSERMVKPLQ